VLLFFWVLLTAFSRLVTEVESAWLLYQFKFSFGLLVALFFQIFTLYFPYRTKINLFHQALIVSSVILSVIIFMAWPQAAINNISILSGNSLVAVNKIYWTLFSFSFTLCFFVAFFRLYKKWREQSDFLKTQIQFVLFSALIPTVFAWFFNITFFFFNEFNYDWLGAFLTFLFSFPLYYFVFYYQKD